MHSAFSGQFLIVDYLLAHRFAVCFIEGGLIT